MASLLPVSYRLLLTAAMRSDAAGLAAYREWRRTVPLDDAPYVAHRVMSQLVDLAAKYGIGDPNIERMRGVRRHVWTTNTLRLRQLFAVLDALAADGIEPMVIKGAALFARAPEMFAARVTEDYDILLPEGSLHRARLALETQGFAPRAYGWDAVESDVSRGSSSGTELMRGSKSAEVDFHWRPLFNIRDPALTERLFASAERLTLEKRSVLAPSIAHHLFLTIARSEPSSPNESFVRLLEAHTVLSLTKADVAWREVTALLRQYGLAAVAVAFLDELRSATGMPVPDEVIRELSASRSLGQRLEFLALRRPEKERRPLQRWLIARQGQKYGKIAARPTAGLAESLLLELPPELPFAMQGLWRHAVRRLADQPADTTFIDGWHYEEPAGRWTSGQLALLSIPPLRDADGRCTVRLRGHAFVGRRGMARLWATAGSDVAARRLRDGAPPLDFVLRARPLAELGGNALVVLRTPDAASPSSFGNSEDGRLLSFFLSATA